MLVSYMPAATNYACAAFFPAQLAQTEAELTRAEGASNPSAWEKASSLWEDLSQPYDTAYCRFRHGEALLAKGETAAGTKLLDEAAQVAVRLGAVPLARKIDAARQ